MLKIKDNVDLKELEKFGFERDFRYKKGNKVEIYTKADKNTDIDIFLDNRKIIIYEDTKEIVFDLIQAGLVEKVEG